MKSSIKTTGAQWLAFYSDDAVWGPGGFHEDLLISVNGVETDNEFDDPYVKPADEVRLITGVIMDAADDPQPRDILSVFRSWNKRQVSTTVLVEVSKDKVPDLLEAIAEVVTAKVVTRGDSGR